MNRCHPLANVGHAEIDDLVVLGHLLLADQELLVLEQRALEQLELLHRRAVRRAERLLADGLDARRRHVGRAHAVPALTGK